jgi:hypothetical protein
MFFIYVFIIMIIISVIFYVKYNETLASEHEIVNTCQDCLNCINKKIKKIGPNKYVCR